jgi:hypothetical protein
LERTEELVEADFYPLRWGAGQDSASRKTFPREIR